jgi:predicted RNA-binding protein YlxR (DUF448 family)
MAPRRTCVGCRTVASPDALVRIRREGDDLVVGAGPGRGVWLCAGSPGACLDRAMRRGALARALRTDLPGGGSERLRAKLVR